MIGSKKQHGHLDRLDGAVAVGWAIDPEYHDRMPNIFAMADGAVIGSVQPYIYRGDVQKVKGRDGVFGFSYRLPESVLAGANSIYFLLETGKMLVNGAVKGDPTPFLVQGGNSLLGTNLISLHIPKSGGSSLGVALQARFGRSLYVIPPGAERRGLPNLPVAQMAQMQCVHGHIAYGCDRLLPGNWTYATVLRDPVSRVLSHYRFALQMSQNLPPIREALETTLNGDFDNLITRYLSGLLKKVPLGKLDNDAVELAIANVERDFSFVGFLDDGPDLDAALGQLLGAGDIRLGEVNVGTNRSVQFSENDIAAVRHHNRFDIALYDRLRAASIAKKTAASGSADLLHHHPQ
ncbi:hypothetical protein HDIA_1028 [Hartmannibacter diazotrophicus]|uniref:Sulfotransferase family protein n=1 Tax=Hartmannibacter diazotrophicus TaxID=1482074 RepID=A0A2C9D301_9HYPH|nr:sulfotransferase family 2 domain-containing protein [Hartmannibacter diazotrophicus]SON54569.1 hypothetical protein HDIA_1028 [Hartmannibacter diazotrophicus]